MKREIYTLEDIKPEVRAVAFAKCSRSPESFRDIAKELTEEKSSEFHEKWVVGYGHSSVAEHAVLSLAMENISILATKVIEDSRLASYTEKSTRYQVFDRNRYYRPRRVTDSEFADIYERTLNGLFDLYADLSAPMLDFMKKKYPRQEESDKLYETKTKARACDEIRYLLPTATLTNLGMTVNARQLEWAITKLLSHPLEEMREIGKEIKEAAVKACPTLIKYAQANNYLIETRQELMKLAKDFLLNDSISNLADDDDPVKIVNYDKEAEEKLIAALLYPYSLLSYEKIKEAIQNLSHEEKEKIIDEAMKRRGDFDRPLRELEHITYTFDILIDYGAFRDIQRHRICTQSNQPISVNFGYATPVGIMEAGFEERFKEAMEKAREAFEKIYVKFPEEAQYAVPLAYRKRVLFTWNLRELHHFISLRSRPQGHYSYRRIAKLCYDKLMETHPLLAKYIRCYYEG